MFEGKVLELEREIARMEKVVAKSLKDDVRAGDV
jgi:hypothetical protein